MKKFFITLIVSFCAMQSIVAQDVLITTEGDVMTVYIEDISSSTIYYKVENSANAQLQRIEKTKVYMIKKADGTKIDLSSVSTPIQETTTATEKPMNAELSEEAKQRNSERIADFNNKVPISKTESKKRKTAKHLFFAMGISKESYLLNDDIELNVEFYNQYNPSSPVARPFSVAVKNNTQKVVYVDLGNTFFVSGGGAIPYYVPTATSTATSSSSGVSVNAGAVTGALGIGGAVGSLANGVNVGGGHNSTTVNIVYSQRIIAIPPLSTIQLEDKPTWNIESGHYGNGIYYSLSRNCPFFRCQNEIAIGEGHTYTENDSPIKFKFYITYSFTEDCSTTKTMTTEIYGRYILGIGISGNGYYDVVDYNGSTGFATRVYYNTDRPPLPGL